ncbi:hypothetical protein ACFMH7_004966 [Escherichia coli O8:H49]
MNYLKTESQVQSKKIFLTGTCHYELYGLHQLLSQKGYNVFHVISSSPCNPDEWDIIIVALSAEPLPGWGRHLSWINEISAHSSSVLLVLVPEKLQTLKVMNNICHIYNGRDKTGRIVDFVTASLNGHIVQTERFILSERQRYVLSRALKTGKGYSFIQKSDERWMYYHHIRLVKNSGLRNFRMLLMTGLCQEIIRLTNNTKDTA